MVVRSFDFKLLLLQVKLNDENLLCFVIKRGALGWLFFSKTKRKAGQSLMRPASMNETCVSLLLLGVRELLAKMRDD